MLWVINIAGITIGVFRNGFQTLVLLDVGVFYILCIYLELGQKSPLKKPVVKLLLVMNTKNVYNPNA